MMSKPLSLCIAALITAAGLSACNDNTAQVCTASFATATTTVVDTTGAPVQAATVSTVLIRTGQTLPITSLLDPVTGVYPILDDGSISQLHASGDSIRVRAVNGAAAVEAVYHFDVPGGCHISKISGPDTLVVR